jgi:simple sugar transport system substrate-binding protein
VNEVLAGKYQPSNVWGGIKDGMVKMAPMNAAVPKDVRDMVAKAEADIAAGKLHPFAGPVKDQSGKERVPAGKSMPDDQLAVMDYYVEGVVEIAVVEIAAPWQRPSQLNGNPVRRRARAA